jgi:hypothetical protein
MIASLRRSAVLFIKIRIKFSKCADHEMHIISATREMFGCNETQAYGTYNLACMLGLILTAPKGIHLSPALFAEPICVVSH